MSPFTKYPDASPVEIDRVLQLASDAFSHYRNSSLEQRAQLMRLIGAGLKKESESLIQTAARETNLTIPRLKTELTRTIFQLESYADHCTSGQWLDVRIDTADKNDLSKKDIRKTMTALGPAAVFGASNFPFAYSTAGGDTACALAAGCPVIVKAHPAHPETSEAVSKIIFQAAKECGLPEGIFSHIHGASFETGEYLVKHPLVKAVGFTGSFSGGKQLYNWANQRKEPIPVYAEMGSVNPVFIFPQKINGQEDELAKKYAESITQSAGQFCTKPGVIAGIESKGFRLFVSKLSELITTEKPSALLHPGIHEKYINRKSSVINQPGITLLAVSQTEPAEGEATPTLIETNASAFLQNPKLHEEVFGPLSLIVVCQSADELHAVVKSFEGQLTASVIATANEMKEHGAIIDSIKQIAGRLIFNGVPTGVRVCLAMHHGGPYPATTNSFFTSVGGDGIKRFARPLVYQDWPEELLPPELQNSNPLKILRTVDNEITREPIN